ncbi:MAG TPA: hypothetical protein HA345_05590 [Candidatus Thalassarchaeaceae archaeon]|nr:MAG TPA: hypothetical protein D7H94_05580 [Candidatus Poseidoniales archaeon]HIH84861.1 hypothetical protein [Candidatus Thalassarchaeaceae archaeon]|tara:strand:+ start:814 stop:1365 length:552 start_codon:yes stop_codon:yes gene_type:complete
MEISRDAIRLFTTIAGGFVLLAYVYGVSRMEDATALWGGVTGMLQRFSIIFMFVAAIGYLIFWWTTLFQMDVAVLADLRWPWSESDGGGTGRLLLAFAIFLIPSMLWLESTGFHLRTDAAWTPALVVGILLLVAIGNVMFGLLGYSAHIDGHPEGKWMIFGAAAISIQCILNDLIIWSWKFPW